MIPPDETPSEGASQPDPDSSEDKKAMWQAADSALRRKVDSLINTRRWVIAFIAVLALFGINAAFVFNGLQSQLSTLGQKVDTAKQTVTTLETDVGSLKNNVTAVESRMNSLSSTLDDEVKSLTKTANDAIQATTRTSTGALQQAISAGAGEITRIAAVKTGELGATATELRAGLRALPDLPIGSVIAFWGKSTDIPANYELCDGEEVTTSDSPVLKQHKPDLRDSFVKGSIKDTKDVTVNPETGGHDFQNLSHRHASGTLYTKIGSYTYGNPTGFLLRVPTAVLSKEGALNILHLRPTTCLPGKSGLLPLLVAKRQTNPSPPSKRSIFVQNSCLCST